MAIVYWAHLPEHTDMFSQGYIGFTSGTLEKRWQGHLTDSKRYPHLTFYRALAKYSDRIIVETLVEGDINYCLDLENKLRPEVKIGWNIKVGGEKGSIGVTASEETKLRMSEARKGDDNAFFGKTHSEEQKALWRETRGGKPFSASAQAKAMETKKNNPWNVTNARKDIWVLADKLHQEFDFGLSLISFSKLVGIPKCSLKTIHKKLKEGWIPIDDPYWNSFKENYIKEKSYVS